MKLYIDTNIYLSYVNPTSDLESLKKLKDLVGVGDVELVLPLKTKEEYSRRYKEMVAKEKERLQKARNQQLIPNDLKNKKGKKTVEDEMIIKQIDSLNVNLKKYRIKKIDNFKKHIGIAEKEIKEIFKLATILKHSDEVVLKALIRYAKDLPPKKMIISLVTLLYGKLLRIIFAMKIL